MISCKDENRDYFITCQQGIFTYRLMEGTYSGKGWQRTIDTYQSQLEECEIDNKGTKTGLCAKFRLPKEIELTNHEKKYSFKIDFNKNVIKGAVNVDLNDKKEVKEKIDVFKPLVDRMRATYGIE